MEHAMPNDAANAKLRDGLRGQLFEPSDAGYADARHLYNAMIDKRPLMIARCADVADVITAVNFGRDNDLLIAVRGGGHSGPGFGSCDDGLVIDLSAMKGVRIDPAARTVRVLAGCTQGDVDHATHAFGLAVPAGIVSTTGISGLTLGGGHGYLSRKHGLTIDNLLEADVVLADGSFVTASNTQNADLFWALRGRHKFPVPGSSRAQGVRRPNLLGDQARPASNAVVSGLPPHST
jgi:FAD/FMN-containing dehydrogenase